MKLKEILVARRIPTGEVFIIETEGVPQKELIVDFNPNTNRFNRASLTNGESFVDVELSEDEERQGIELIKLYKSKIEGEIPNLDIGIQMAGTIEIEVFPQSKKSNYKFDSSVRVSNCFADTFKQMLVPVIAIVTIVLEKIKDKDFIQRMKINGVEVIAMDELSKVTLMISSEY